MWEGRGEESKRQCKRNRSGLSFQIWDWDPEVNSSRLTIDVDLLQFSYDSALHRLLDNLMRHDGVSVDRAGLDEATWTFDMLIKILELSVIVVGVVFKIAQLSSQR